MSDFWLDRLTRKTSLPYPAFFAVVSLVLYGVGLALAATTGNVRPLLSEPGWILVSLFGFVNGTAVLYAVRGFGSAMQRASWLTGLDDDEFHRARERLGGLATSDLHWIFVAGWFLFSITHVLILGQPSWWSRSGSYNYPLLIDAYGLVAQGWNGCVLGGIFMFVVPIGLNLAYRGVCQEGFLGQKAAAAEGTEALSGFTRLITVNTLSAAVLSALAIGLWARIPSRYVVYIPIVGSAFMLLPTAIIPHYLFHGLLSRARQAKLNGLDCEVETVLGETSEASLSHIVALQRLFREERKAEKAKTWLVDPGTVAELVLAASAHGLVMVVLRLLHISH